MNIITVPGLSDGLVQRLQVRSAAKGRTLEETALEILNSALPGSDQAVPEHPDSAKEAYERIRAMYAEIGFRDSNHEPPLLTACYCPCHDVG